MNSRAKGCRGELEAARAWAETFGVDARRGQQFSGSQDSPDIVTEHTGLHLEVKRCEKGNLYDWMAQAVRDSGDRIPVVLHRRNGKEWILIARLSDAPALAAELTAKAQTVGAGTIPCELSRAGLPAIRTQGCERT